ncbi:MAG: motif domain protein [Nocardioidaceae bacterium]|nr:motif domain protein [Nocardioidaceae bacterium]
MGKRSRDRNRAGTATATVGEVGPRQPCPCGSGRRYKACHGSASGAPTYVARPFADLPGECDLVAMREFVPAATAPVTVKGHEDRVVQLCSLLPAAAPAIVRPDGEVWLGLQVQHAFRDPSRDLAAVLELALQGEPGSDIVLTDDPGDGVRLQDLLLGDTLEVSVHAGFDYWLAGVDDPSGGLGAALEQANAAISPTAGLASVDAAYWTDVGTKAYLRWAMPYDEGPLLDALARLHVAGADRLVDDARLVGMFRAHGLLVPVWDLAAGIGVEDLEDPAAEFAAALEASLAEGGSLSGEERAARAGLANRQLTLR